MGDDLYRQAEREWRLHPDDPAACERFLRECGRAGVDPPLELLERRVFAPRRLELPEELRSAWVAPWPAAAPRYLFGSSWHDRPWVKEVPRPPGPFEVDAHVGLGIEVAPLDLASLSHTLRELFRACSGEDLHLWLTALPCSSPMPDVGPAALARLELLPDPRAEIRDAAPVLGGLTQLTVGLLVVSGEIDASAPLPACGWGLELRDLDPGVEVALLDQLVTRSPRLRALSLPRWDRPFGELRRLPALERLELGLFGRRLEEKDGAALSGLAHLRQLGLCSASIGPGFFAALSEGAARVERLRLTGNTELLGTKVLREVGRLTSLREVWASVPAVALKGWERLERLETLDLSGEGTLDHVALAFVSSLPCLRWLRLDFCGVSDLVAQGLAASQSLECVSLHHSDALTDRGLLALRAMPSLRHVSLFDTATTEAGRDAFRAARPDVTVQP